MIRGSLTRMALLAFPADVRDERGAEMAATLLDASAGSRVRFARELSGIVRGGLHVRATRSASAGTRRVVADGLCLAGVWFMVLDLSTLLAQTARGMHDPLLAPPSIILLATALALALIGYDRVAGAAALVWVAARSPAVLDHRPGAALAVVLATLPSLTCFAVLVAAPRARPRDLRRLAWLLVPATLVLAFGPAKPDQSPLLLAIVVIGVLVVALYALATLATDPRVAIAGAVVMTAVGIGAGSGNALALAVTVLLVVVVAMVRSRRRVVAV